MDTLTLLSWNVRYFAHALRGMHATRGNVEAVADALVAAGPPDVVALQEVEVRSLRGGLEARPQLERLLDALRERGVAYDGHYFPSHVYGVAAMPLYTQGLAVLTRGVDVVATDQQAVTHVRLPLFAKLKQQRIVARVRVRRGTSTLDVYDTHLSLPAFFEVGPNLPRWMGHGSNQQVEAAAVRAIVEASPAAVLVGDFNAKPGSPAYALLAEVFQDPFRDQHDVPTAGFGGSRMHIDHVFLHGAAQCLSAESYSYDARDHPFAGWSDHMPKRVVLGFDSPS